MAQILQIEIPPKDKKEIVKEYKMSKFAQQPKKDLSRYDECLTCQ
jgi:hypothetical protein